MKLIDIKRKLYYNNSDEIVKKQYLKGGMHMKLTIYDTRDIGETLLRLSESEALERLANGEEIFLRTRPRDIYAKVTLADIEQTKRLRELGVYDRLEYYKKPNQ